MTADAHSTRTPLDYDTIMACDRVTDAAYRSVRLDTCCTNPFKHAIPSHDIFVCGSCGAIDVQGKFFSKEGWELRSLLTRKRHQILRESREAVAGGSASHAVSGMSSNHEGVRHDEATK